MKWVYSGYSTATPSSSNLIKIYDYVYSSSMDDMAWDDLLTEYDGEAIVYDNIGNPTTYRGKTMLWEGRNLTGFYDSDSAAIYAYDSSGIRTMKLCDGEVYYYYYVEGKLMSETCSQYDLFYTYDSRGNLSGIKKVDNNGTTTNYGVLSNMFGDVLGIFDLSGNLLAKYTYDSWGKLLSITNASGTDISGTTGIWTQNSIRYRGYVYDNESGWYYLQSRYYDPEICRFINADGMLAATNNFTINLFAYADCNPLVNVDPTGTCPYNGTAADFHRLEQGLRPINCNCSLSNTISTINESVGITADLSVDILLHAIANDSRSSFWPINDYNNYITSAIQTTYSLSELFHNLGFGIASICVFIETIEGVCDNNSNGASNEKIVWDIIIDLSFGTASIFASNAAATAVGAFVGTYIPIPIVGTAIGALAGFGVGYVVDLTATKVKSLYKK